MPEKSGPAAEKSATTLPGTVQKIIHSPDPGIPEKAEIAVEGADDLYKEIRIENTLEDSKGVKVKLKPGAEVEVTVEADVKDTTPANEPSGDSSSRSAKESRKK